MTYRQGQSSTAPWLTPTAPRTHTGLPPMEPLPLKPMEPLQPKATSPAAQHSPRKRQTRPGPQARRAAKREVHAKLVQAAQEQPRDSIGRFAEKGNIFTHFFDPTPHAPTRLKPLKAPKQAGQQKHPVSSLPRARISKQKHKKPVPERSMLGKIVALFNGDYSRWRMRNLREQARLRAQIDGYYTPPKKRIRRRRKSPPAKPTQPARKKKGLVRRILGF